MNQVANKVAVSLLAMAWAGGAAAQQLPDAPAENGAGAANTEEIIVTAQRREERLVDVPLSVALVSSEELDRAGSDSLVALNRLVPGVYMQRDIYGLAPTIRGIGSTLASSSGGGNISIYVDGVYMNYKPTSIFDLASVSDVQVLKGPQGTLFGRNATGGAILVTTLDPSFEPEARFRVSYEEFGTVRSSAYLNLPITDTFAANVAASYRHSDGYIRDARTDEILNEGEEYSVRAKLLYEPTNDLSFMLTGYHSRFDDPTGANYQNLEQAPFFSLPGIPGLYGPYANDRYHSSHNNQGVIRTGADQYSFDVNWQTSFGTIHATTAYQENDLYSINDVDGTYSPPLPGLEDFNSWVEFSTVNEQFTQEINLTSNPGTALQYVAGVMYFENTSSVPTPLLVSGNRDFETTGETSAVAGYFDANYHLTDNWVLIGGIRYTHEDRQVDSIRYDDPNPAIPRHQERREDTWTPRVGVKYEFTPDSNVYATYTRGYKAGIFDATSPTAIQVEPEFVDAYEIGFKTTSQDFTLNTALYYYDFTDTQVNATFSDGSDIYQQLFNVPQSEIYGFDIDGSYRFNESWDVRGSLAYTHATYENFPNAPAYIIDPTDPETLGLVYSNIAVDASGSRMVRAPEWTASTAINYHADLGTAVRFDASLSGAYTSRVFFNFTNTLSQDPYVIVDANATFTIDDSVTLSVFGRNLTDEIYNTSMGQNPFGTAGTYGMPSVYGVSVGYTF